MAADPAVGLPEIGIVPFSGEGRRLTGESVPVSAEEAEANKAAQAAAHARAVADFPLLAHGFSGLVAVALHPQGAFGVTVDGEEREITGRKTASFWAHMNSCGPIGLPISDSEILTFGFTSVSKIAQGRLTPLTKGNWNLVKAMVRSSRVPTSVFLFHEWGLFRFNTQDGMHEKLGGTWFKLKAVLHEKESDAAIAFHDWGTYRVDLSDGACTKIGNDSWKHATAAVWSSEGPLVFHRRGISRLRLSDGTACEIATEPLWGSALAAVDAGDGTALVFCIDGLFKVNLSHGSSTKLEGSRSWRGLHGVWPLSPDSRAVTRPVSSK
mmetsp:Transcript_55611/g.162577  ORF Transcript_55611/g.162577 Transcript_55611/m.162577 type:complete len:324 (-) Transcript_55611:37-1008(-)